MPNPVPGPTSPDSPRGSSRVSPKPDDGKFKDAMKRVEGVEKVGETELEKQDRRQLPDQIPEEEEEEPSEEVEGYQPLPNPNRDPPPLSEDQEPNEPSDLPQSNQFWKSSSLPDEPTMPHFQEKRGIAGGKKAQEGKAKKKTEAAPFFAPPWESVEAGKMSKKPIKEEAPEGAIASWQLESPLTKKGAGEDASTREARRRTLQRTEEDRQEHKRPFEQIKEVLLPDPLPPAIQSIVSSVQSSPAMPQLNPQIDRLFLQLVGTILFITPSTPGISRTEVLLNSMALRNSVFFNSTVILEKYATAPDSFNIQFVGSSAAVSLALQHKNALLSSFAAAYQDKRISFRIGRFDAFLPTERQHLIRRKKELGGEKGEHPIS